MWALFGRLGRTVLGTLERTGLGVVILLRALSWLHWVPKRFRAILTQMYVTGVQSLAVTLLFSTVAGMIISLQTGLELRRFGIEDRIGSIVALSMLREMGPLMCAIILTGRVGSSMAAEIGTMNVSEEVSALETLAIDPVRFLVMPRVVAMMLITPMLTVLASLVGILGGAFVSWAQVGVEPASFLASAQRAIFFRDIYWGIGKAVLFGLSISTIACAAGLTARDGAIGVGRASRDAVVTALILVIVTNYIVSSFFLALSPV